MGQVLKFPGDKKSKRMSKINEVEIKKLLEVSNAIDNIIVESLESGDVQARDVAGVLAHRLGALMRHSDKKDILWDVCEKVVKRQAAIDS